MFVISLVGRLLDEFKWKLNFGVGILLDVVFKL